LQFPHSYAASRAITETSMTGNYAELSSTLKVFSLSANGFRVYSLTWRGGGSS
jgi:hypothetical protein